MQKENEAPSPLMIFEELEGDGSHWGITDLYDEREMALRGTLKMGLPFDTGWWSSKKEIQSARVQRIEPNGAIYIEVSAGMDYSPDLVDTAFWKAAGGNENARSGYEALQKAGVAEEDIDTVIDEIMDACELGEDNYANREKALPKGCSYDLIIEQLDGLVDEASAELEATFQSVITTCKWKLDQLKEK